MNQLFLRWAVGVSLALLPSLALAQSAPVFQTGQMHPHDLPKFYTNGLIGSASLNGTEGDNSGEGVNPFVIDDHGAEALCWSTDKTTATHHIACLGHNATDDAILSLDGVDYAFPPAGNGNTLGPVSSVQDNIAAWNNDLGTALKDSGIPFAAVPKGRMVIYPAPGWTSDPTSTVAWTVVTPPDVPFTCAFTFSQCVGDAWAFAELHGLSVDTYCRGENQLGPVDSGDGRLTQDNAFYQYISASVPLNTGNLVQRYFHAGGCNLTFSTAVTETGLTVNAALDGGDFDWKGGQIVYTYNTPSESSFPVVIRPSTCPPVESCAALVTQNARINLPAIAGATSPGAAHHGAVLGIDASLGSVFADHITIGELNGCGPCTPSASVFKDGIRVFGGSTTRGVFRNIIEVGYIHNVDRLIDWGSTDNTDTGAPKAYGANQVTLQHGSPQSETGTCVIDTGQRNRWNILSCNNDSIYPLTYDTAITFTETANQGVVDLVDARGYGHTITTYLGATTFPINDGGTTNSYSLHGAEIQKWGGLTFCDGSSSYSGLACGGGSPPPGAGGVRNYMPLLSFSSGTGATASGTATNSFGAIVVGTDNPTTVTINFSGAGFLRAPGCFASSSASFMQVTSASPTSVVFTSSAPMGAGTLVAYQCSSLL